MDGIFEKIIAREVPADIVYEDETVIAFLDISPIRKGHTLVVPKKKFENIFDGDPETLEHMIRAAQKIARALVHATGAHGVNILMNNGHAAGQDVPHAHMHIIPRFKRGEAFSVPDHEKYESGERAVIADAIKKSIGA
jgi:histidine triad (HIT) family protein